MNICPNKAHPDYQALIEAFGGSEAKAFQAWYRQNNAKPGDQFEIPMAEGSDQLSFFDASQNEVDFETDERLQVKFKVAQKLFHNWRGIYGQDILGTQFQSYKDLPMPEPFNQINPDTQEIYTYGEWLDFNTDLYERRFNELMEINENLSKEGFLPGLSLEKLRELNIRMDTKFNVADKLLQQEHALPFITVRTEYYNRLVSEMLKKHEDAGQNISELRQRDADVFDLGVTAITDFSAEHPELQALGIMTQKHFSKAEREAQQTLANLNSHMKDVIEAHYAHKGKSWLSKLDMFTNNAYMRNAFDWMIEKDSSGKPTGRFISRYEETEKKWLEAAFARDWNEHVQANTYVISNRKILGALSAGRPSTFLNPTELMAFRAIVQRFNSIYSKGYDALTPTEKRTYGEDTNKIRRFWAKMNVKKHESKAFKDMRALIASNPNSPEAKLAEARIRFYDFIYDRSSELMFHNNNMDYTIERAMMPQVGIQVMEALSNVKEKSLAGKIAKGFKTVFRVFFRDENIDSMNLRTHDGLLIDNVQFASFKESTKVPLRTIHPIKDFAENGSTDIYAILRYHFANQINAKNLSPLLADFHAVYNGLEMKGVDMDGKEFTRTKKYIEQFAEQYILSKTSDWQRTWQAKTANLMKNLSILQFLGMNPGTSAINLFQGLSDDFKMMVGKYGWAKGTQMMGTGFNRLFGKSLTNMDTVFFDPKAFAILEYYGIETFTKSEIDKFNSIPGKIQDVMMFMQSKGESIIWGVGLLGQMSQEEWDNFILTDKGALHVKDTSLIKKYSGLLDLHPLFEQKYNLGSHLGKYYTGGRRLTKDKWFLHLAMPFKGWIWDYFRIRFQSEKINMFSKKEEGYYTGAFRLAARKAHAMFSAHERAAQAMSGKDKLTDLDMQNLRMIAFDLLQGAILFLLYSAGANDDREDNPYQKFITKVSAQMYMFLYLENMVKLVKQPFATLHDVEMAAKFMQGAINLEPEKMGKAMYGILPTPGKAAVDALMEESDSE